MWFNENRLNSAVCGTYDVSGTAASCRPALASKSAAVQKIPHSGAERTVAVGHLAERQRKADFFGGSGIASEIVEATIHGGRVMFYTFH